MTAPGTYPPTVPATSPTVTPSRAERCCYIFGCELPPVIQIPVPARSLNGGHALICCAPHFTELLNAPMATPREAVTVQCHLLTYAEPLQPLLVVVADRRHP